MKRIILFLLLIVVVAGVSAFCAMRFSRACGMCEKPQSNCAPHDWLHAKLQLTPEQKEAMAPIENRFHQLYEQADARLQEANRDLARTLEKSPSFSPEVSAAIEHVHHRMGELQKLSIQHLYEMKTVLTPEQNETLMRTAQQALETAP